MNVHSKGDHPQPTPFTVAFAGFVSAHLQSTYCLRVNRGKPMQSSGWPSTFHHPFHLPEERQTPVDMADKDSSFSSLLTAIRSQSLTVRGSTSASQCSLWCNPSPPPPPLQCSDFLHLPDGADLHWGRDGLVNLVYKNASCDVSSQFPRPSFSVPLRTCPHMKKSPAASQCSQQE